MAKTKFEVVNYCRMFNNEVCIALRTKSYVSAQQLKRIQVAVNKELDIQGFIELKSQNTPEKGINMLYAEYLTTDKEARDVVQSVRTAIEAAFPGAPFETFLFNSLLDKTFTYRRSDETPDRTTK